MESNNNRRILIAVGFVLFFVVIVLVWYFFYAKPIIAPTLSGTNNPLPTRVFPSRFQFINWGGGETSSSTTEVTNPSPKALIKIWGAPSTGQAFTIVQSLKEINATSTTGTTTIQVKKVVRATSTIVMFVDRTTGYIYGYPLESGKVFQISNTILPGIRDAYFFDNGRRVIMRYIDHNKNIAVGLIANVPSVEETGSALPLEKVQYLPSQILSVAINQTKNEASYVVATEGGSTVYTVDSLKEPHIVVSSPFREWDISYGGSSLYVTTKPSAYVEGATFRLPFFHLEVSEKTGLMSNPGSSDLLLNSMWGDKGLITFLSGNGNIRILKDATLASKCAWGKRNLLVCAIPRILLKGEEGLPDDWFQGRVSFTDDLAIIDKTTGDRYTLYNFTKEDGLFDVVGISVSDEDSLFVFNKKQDGSLWLLNTNLIKGD